MQSVIKVASGAVAAALLFSCSSRDREKSTGYYDNETSIYQEKEKGKSGGTLNIVTPRDLTTIDLQRTAGPRNGWYGRLLFDSLVYLNEAGEITPWLAKSWAISPDGKTYTFYLRDDVSFSDGTKFDAEAVRVNFARIRDPKTKAAVTTSYIEPYLEGKAIDKYVFQATLSRPHTPFLKLLSLSIFGFYSPKQILEAPETIAEKPIGTGPFVLEKWTPQESVSFVRRPDYNWAPSYVKHEGPAYLDRVLVKIVPEIIVSSSSLLSGQFQMSVDAQAQLVNSVRNNKDFTFTSRVLKGNPLQAPVFNTSVAPFNDLIVRKAFVSALDREALVITKGFGTLRLKSDFLSEKTEYYDPTHGHDLKYDVNEANRLLDQAGWTGHDSEGYRTKNGKRLGAEVLTSSAATSNDLLPLIQSDVKKIGFDLKIIQLPALEYSARRSEGTYQALGSTSLHTSTADALYIFFHSSQVPTKERISVNTSRLSDPELDGYLDAARQTVDPAQLRVLYSNAQRRLVELVPAAPLYENTVFVAYNNKTLKGVTYDTTHDLPYLLTAWLSK